MPIHVVHVLDDHRPYRIVFHSTFDQEMEEVLRGRPFRGVAESVGRRPLVRDESFVETDDGDDAVIPETSRASVFVVEHGVDAWAFGEVTEVLAFLSDRGAPNHPGLPAALDEEALLATNPNTRRKERHWEPNLREVETYVVRSAHRFPNGEIDSPAPWTSVAAALDAASASPDGAGVVLIGSLPVFGGHALGHPGDLGDCLACLAGGTWAHRDLVALLEREAANAPQPG